MIFLSNDIISTSNCVQGQTTRGALRRLSEYLRPRRIFIQFPRILKMACPPPRTHCFLQWKIWLFIFICTLTVCGCWQLWAVWHLESLLRCCCVLLILRASRGRSETSQRYDDDVYQRGACKQEWKQGFTNLVFQPNLTSSQASKLR